MQFTAEGVEQAGQIWEEGLAKFPNSALLQVNLGWYHLGRAYNGFSNDPTSDFRKAGELVRQALAHPNPLRSSGGSATGSLPCTPTCGRESSTRR